MKASPGATIGALNLVRTRELPITAMLMTLRMAPAALARRRLPAAPDQPLLDQFAGLGFVELDRGDDEVVLGTVGRFWRLREELKRLEDASAFERFDRPGFAKGAISFRARPDGDGALLTTETRVLALGADARRAFARYWILVRLGGEPIRRELLRAIARHAERGS